MSLGWVRDACDLLLAPDASLDGIARWLGTEPPAGGRLLRVDRPQRVGALNVVALERDGAPAFVSAHYAAGEGPTLAAVEAELGPAEEMPGPVVGPYQVAFDAPPPSAAAACVVLATTDGPPGEPATDRRVVEIVVRRDAA